MITVCSFLRPEDPLFVADDVFGVHLAQCPNRDHVMPPKVPPASTGSSEDIPAATCTSNVSRHEPVIAMPLPRSKSLMTFPSYPSVQSVQVRSFAWFEGGDLCSSC